MKKVEHFIGSTSIVKLPELDLNEFKVTQLLPGLNKEVLKKHIDWMDNRVYDAESDLVFLSVHTWVVRHNRKIILIDTGAGNKKKRPTLKVLDHLHNPYLKRLKAIGVAPEDVDYILLTHIHADHVGWNTTLKDDKWIPTFPNARVICSEMKWKYAAALEAGDETAINLVRKEAGLGEPVRLPVPGVFADSMKPIKEAGLLQCITIDGSEIFEGVRFLPTPGHSICHASISISSSGEEGIFGGDVIHHPFELHDTNLMSMFCEFPDAARASRRQLAARVADHRATFFSSHFPESSVGNIFHNNENFRWQFIE